MVKCVKRRSNSIRRFDWTRDNPQAVTDFQRCIREHVDWQKSPLGQMYQWPAELRQMVLLCMADSSPSAVLYGPVGDSAIVYNEVFAILIGSKHPNLQGQLLRNELDDLCKELPHVWQRQSTNGCTESVRNQRVRQDRLGFVEEKMYTWKFVPIIGEDGFVVGSLVTVDEENRNPPRRERTKSAVKEFGNVVKSAIDRTANQTKIGMLQLDGHFSGRSCNCEKLWQASQQLQINEAWYERFADYAPVGIVALNKAYEVEWANKAYYDVISQPVDSKSLLNYIHADDAAMVQGQFDSGAFRDDSFGFECRLKKWATLPAVSPAETPGEPSPAWILVSAYRETEHEQRTMCWIIDITSHKNAEEFLRKRMDEAMEMKQQKERFIDMISHEVRNPLSAMFHCTDDIIENCRENKDNSSSSILESAETIAYCTQHIRDIVGDVLTLSKLDSRLVEICPKPTRPREIVDNALKIFQGELKAGGIELTFDEHSSVRELRIEWLLLDPNRMLQVLINLVTNAIKVVKDRPQRKISVKLSATTKAPCEDTGMFQCVLPRQILKPVDFGLPHNREQSIWIAIAVEDSGPGLDTLEMETLFERFAQDNPKTESKYGGSGLGLFISRDLTELQGGRIGVSSQPGVGSKFVFSVEAKRVADPECLPRVPSIDIPARLRESRSVSASPIAILPPEPLHGPGVTRAQQDTKPAARKVLVVEDNTINAKVLSNQLRKRGFEVEVAFHGQQALDLLQIGSISTESSTRRDSAGSSSFDVVLMDIEMPVMDGITCSEIIREFEANKDAMRRLPIIAVTANARSEHGTAAIKAGMDAITTKPYKIEDLVAQIELACKPAG